MKLYITRGTAQALSFRGLGAVFIWFNEPVLTIGETLDNDEPFQLTSLKDELQGSLYTGNKWHNFIYRESNNVNSNFGGKLIRNPDGIDFPEILAEYLNQDKLYFKHEVFGSGPKTNYSPIKVSSSFGYDSPLSDYIWEIVCNEFGNIPMEEWDKFEKEIPWWNFCKEVEIEINLISQ